MGPPPCSVPLVISAPGLAKCSLASKAPTSRCHARRLEVVDQQYDQLLSVLSWHSPRHRAASRRRQPSWWTCECFSACVARNGAWRDHRRDPTPSCTLASGRSALCPTLLLVAMAISCLHLTQPRQAASVFRRNFRGPTESRGDQSDQVRWSPDGNSSATQQEPLENWRRHLASVRLPLLMVRQALILCGDSAVGIDGFRTSCSSSISRGGRSLSSLSSTSFSHGVMFPQCGNGASLALVFKR